MSALIRNMRLLLLLTIPLVLGSFSMPLSAQQTQPFDVADVFFELNDTDGDLGIHAEIDGDTWTSLEVKGPLHLLLSIVSNGRLRSRD